MQTRVPVGVEPAREVASLEGGRAPAAPETAAVARGGERRQLALRFAVLSLLAFTAMVSYAIARPATESLFLASHTSEGLPLAWVLVALAAVAVTSAYGRAVVRVDLVRLYGSSAGLAALALLALLALRAAGAPAVDYALYVWKDIYVVVIVEAFYTYTNAVFPIRTARWAYGLFGLVAALGSIVGNLAVGPLAARLGSDGALVIVAPLLALLWLVCLPFARLAGRRAPAELSTLSGRLGDALGVVARSRYLLAVLLLIGVVQAAVTLIDLEWNAVVERAYPATDERTAVIGRVYAVTAGASVVLNLLTGPILRLAGVPLSLLAVPVALAIGLGSYALAPRVGLAALAKVASKALDYTIFRAAKEILYIPLDYAEKTLGKSLVDLLAYRLAKGAISLVLFGLGLAGLARHAALPAAFALLGVWVGLTLVVARRFRREVSREDELRAAPAGARRPAPPAGGPPGPRS